MTERHWCQELTTIRETKFHYVLHGCERARRIMNLIVNREMSLRAASIVVDAAMYDFGCVEGKVRDKIEAQKKEPTSEDVG
jgi:hypothetical protein